jgi:PAS domain S-box-containing protein
LKISSAIDPSAFKLSYQGLLLVSILLLFELLFIGALYKLLDEAEVEAVREEHAKQVVAKATRLVKVIFETGDFAEKYALTQDPKMRANYQAGQKEAAEILPWLKANIHDPEELEPIQRVEETLLRGTKMTDYVVHLIDGGQLLKAAAYVHKKQQELQPVIKTLIPDLERLLDTQKKIELETPNLQRAARDKAKFFLLVGLTVNIIIALTLALFLFKRITSKIDLLVDNAKRLSAGAELNPKLKGRDEISVLDRVFHEMADFLKEEEDVLRTSEARVRSIIEEMPVGLIILTESGALEFANPIVEKMFGYSPRQLIKRPLSDLFVTTDDLDSILHKAESKTVELTAVTKEKVEFPIELSISPITLFVGERRLATVLDVTERSEIQRLRQAFVAMVSHELRTPLSSVRGFLTLLSIGAYGSLSAEAATGAERAENNVVRLIALINDLLDLEKMETGNLDMEPSDTLVSLVVGQSIDAVKQFAEEHEVVIEAPTADYSFYADPDRIVQVLVNLLANAIKYSPQASIVKIEVSQSSDKVEFRVIDTGRGIPENFKETIFERFQQVDSSDAKVRGGTGLGLAICKSIIEQHQGTIGVTSEPGQGSVFWFTLPTQKMPSAKQQQDAKT